MGGVLASATSADERAQRLPLLQPNHDAATIRSRSRASVDLLTGRGPSCSCCALYPLVRHGQLARHDWTRAREETEARHVADDRENAGEDDELQHVPASRLRHDLPHKPAARMRDG